MQEPGKQVKSAAGFPASSRQKRPSPVVSGRGQGIPRAARWSCNARQIEFAQRQAFEDRQYPAATSDAHEIVRVLHAGRDAGQLTRSTNTEWLKPEN